MFVCPFIIETWITDANRQLFFFASFTTFIFVYTHTHTKYQHKKFMQFKSTCEYLISGWIALVVSILQVHSIPYGNLLFSLSIYTSVTEREPFVSSD